MINVNHPSIFDIKPLVLPSSIFLSLAILIIAKRIGTAIIPLITAVYIRALIGLILTKFIRKTYDCGYCYY